MKKAVTLAAIAGLSLASDFEDTELISLPFKSTQPLLHNTQALFHDDNLVGETRSKLSIFTKKSTEKTDKTEKTEHDDELMTFGEFLKVQPKLISIPERQILDIRTRIPVVSVLPAEQPKTEEEDNNKPKERSNFSIFDRKMAEKSVVEIQKQAKVPVSIIEKTEEEQENANKPKRSNFSIFDRKEGEKTEEENHHGKSATRSGFSILNRKHATSGDVQHVHAKRDLEALVEKLLRHKVVKTSNEFFGLRDLKKGGDKDSNKVNVLKLDSEEDNDLFGMRDWKKGDRDGKAGVLGFDDEESNELYGMRDWKRFEKDSGKAGVLGLDDEEGNELYGMNWKRYDKDSGKAGILGLDDEDNEFFGLRDLKKGGDKNSDKVNILKFDSEEDNELYGMRDWKRFEKDSGKAGVLGLDDEDNEFRVLGNLIHDGLDIYRDVKNKEYGKAVAHGVKAAHDVHELTKKRNFLGN